MVFDETLWWCVWWCWLYGPTRTAHAHETAGTTTRTRWTLKPCIHEGRTYDKKAQIVWSYGSQLLTKFRRDETSLLPRPLIRWQNACSTLGAFDKRLVCSAIVFSSMQRKRGWSDALVRRSKYDILWTEWVINPIPSQHFVSLSLVGRLLVFMRDVIEFLFLGQTHEYIKQAMDFSMS